MKTKKINVRLILVILMLGVLAAGYKFGYMDVKAETDALEEERASLQAKVDELRLIDANRQTYIEETEKTAEKIKLALKKFGAGNSPEKSIMFIVGLTELCDFKVASIAFSESQNIFTSTNIPTDDMLGIAAYSSPLTISYQSTYDGLKGTVDYINNYSEFMNVQSVSMAYDQSTGNLSGSMTINLYAVIGNGKVYDAPIVGGVDLGTDNIFSTGEIPMDRELEVEGN